MIDQPAARARMVADPFARTVTRLGQLVGDGLESLSDVELLRRFTAAGDGHAFAALVRRHGPMVFGVCRRTLGHVQDAEDAFQATFMVLARKAHAVRPDGVGRWLYGVAVRVANKARVRRARREPVPAELNELPSPPAPGPSDWLPLLDAALSRLPDRDRRPILLCDLQGRSRAEAAAELGIAEGTLSSRLARARARLRSKLVRLGVAPGVAATVAFHPEPVPAALIESMITGGAPVAARHLAEGVVRSMFLFKLTKLAAAACVVGVVTVGIVAVPGAGAESAQSKPGGKEKAPPAAAKDEARLKSGALRDMERINGVWAIVEVISPGRNAADARALLGKEIGFDRGQLSTDLLPGAQKTYRLDPGWDPKHIDFVLKDTRGPDVSLIRAFGDLPKEINVPAIYKFDGDRLHLGIGSSGREERPESFDAKGQLFTHVVLRKKSSPDRSDPERQELEGTWELIAGEAGGVRQPMSDSKLVFEGDRLRIYPRGGNTPTELEYVVDPKPNPRHIDLTVAADREQLKKGQPIKGLYSLDGNLLTVNFGGVGEERPKSLTEKNRPTMYYRRAGTDVKLPPGGASPRLRQLQEERVKALQIQLQGQFERVKIGKDPLIQLVDAVRELAEAELDVAQTHEHKVAAVERMVTFLVDMEKQVIELQAVGLQTQQGVAQAKAARLKAEVQLEKLKAGQ